MNLQMLRLRGGCFLSSQPSLNRNAPRYLTLYISIVFASAAVFSVEYIYQVLAGIRASRTIHLALIDSVLGSTLRCVVVHSQRRDKTDVSQMA